MSGDAAGGAAGIEAFELRLEGVTLPQLAGVVAALAEEIELEVVLEREGIDAASWPKAAGAWRVAIAKAPDLQLRYVEKLREAEDCLARPVRPLDDDPAAWAGLLGALSVGGAAATLGALGLRMSDVARIGRAWAEKARREPGVAKALADAAGRSAAPARVECGPTTYRGFQWSPAPPKRATSGGAAVAAGDVSMTDRLLHRVDGVLPVARDVDLFAALEVALEIEPEQKSVLLALTGLAASEHDDVVARWESRFARSAETRAAFIARSGDHRTALRRLLRGAVPVRTDIDDQDGERRHEDGTARSEAG